MTHPRGDVCIKIDGEERILRLTLGALADIEAALGGDVEALAERLKKPRVGDMLLILHALLAGGGTALTLEALKASKIDLSEAARAIGEAFEALGGDASALDVLAPNPSPVYGGGVAESDGGGRL